MTNDEMRDAIQGWLEDEIDWMQRRRRSLQKQIEEDRRDLHAVENELSKTLAAWHAIQCDPSDPAEEIRLAKATISRRQLDLLENEIYDPEELP